MEIEELLRELHDRRLRDSDVILAAVNRVAVEEWQMGTRTMGFAALAYGLFVLFLSSTGALPAYYFAACVIAGALAAMIGAWRLEMLLTAWKAKMRARMDEWERQELARYTGDDSLAGDPA